MKAESRILILSVVLLVVSLLLSLLFGSVNLSPSELLRGALKGPKDTEGFIFYYSRLPRTVAALFSGFALALSGAILQSVLSNSLAAPGIIGVNSGAGLLVTVSLVLGALSGWTISLSAFFGALLSSLLILMLSRKIRASRSTVLLSGVSLNYIFKALSDILSVLFPKEASVSGDFKVGGFSSLSLVRLYPAVAVIALAAIVAFTLSEELEVLSMGENEAKALGMNTGLMRALFVVLSSLLAGAAVSFSGLLGFVGLLVPNGVRRILKGERRFYLPLSAISGAIFVTLADTFSRLFFQPYEVPVGIIVSLIGGPVFLYMVIRGRK